MLPVLVVEDNPLVAEATGTLLARYGDDVTPMICLDAIRAIRALNDRRDAWFRIFVDLDVRASEGPSVVQEVRRHGLAERCCLIGETDDLEFVEQIKAWNFLGFMDRASPVSVFTAALISILQEPPHFRRRRHLAKGPRRS